VTAWYEPGIGMVEDVSGTPVVKYYHDNLIGTTRFMSNASGNKIETAVYTAFGERVDGDARRFGYAGAHGYQTDGLGEMPFLHVGRRYYGPWFGRFVQRDPLGIEGGVNTYAYVDNSPTSWLDPNGEGPFSGLNKGKMRFGPSKVRIGYRRWGTRIAFRYKNVHIYGWRGVGAAGGLVCLSAAAGGATGYGISRIKVRRKRISQHIGEFLYRTCPKCWDW
jgi:RHS repeat-associated protein